MSEDQAEREGRYRHWRREGFGSDEAWRRADLFGLYVVPADELPQGEPDGQFATFTEWVNKATSWIGGENALCADAKGRVCRRGADFMRARDEGAFPVRFWFGAGPETEAEQRRSARAARRVLRRPHGGMV